MLPRRRWPPRLQAASVDFPLPSVTTALAAAVTIPVFANGGIADPAQCLQTQLQGVTCSSWETHE
jgi:hypothetical protein